MAVRPARPALGGISQVVPPRDVSKVVPSQASHSPRETPAKAAARTGKVQLSGYIDRDYKRQLDIHAAREGITIQAIVEEMYDLYATAHGLHRLGHLVDP